MPQKHPMPVILIDKANRKLTGIQRRYTDLYDRRGWKINPLSSCR